MSKQPHFSLYINGEFRAGDTQQIMSSSNPANGQIWASFDCASKNDVEQAVQAAKSALNAPEWAQLTASQRAKLIYKLADLVGRGLRYSTLECSDVFNRHQIRPCSGRRLYRDY